MISLFRIIALLVFLGCVGTVIADANDDSVETRLQDLGLPEKLPMIVLSSLSHDAAYIEHAELLETWDGSETRLEGFLVFSRDTRGNIDLRVKYDPLKYSEYKAKLLDIIRADTKLQYRIKKYGSTYDPNTVQVERVDDNQVLVRLQFSEYALPQDIAYFRHMVAEFKLVDGVLVSAHITNQRPFNYNKRNIERYEQTLDFIKYGKDYAVSQRLTKLQGTYKGKPYSRVSKGKFVAFYDESGNAEVVDSERFQLASNPRLQEQKLDLDRRLPFMAEMVRQQGIDLPLPIGFSVNYRTQDLDMGFTSFSIADIPSDVLGKFFNPDLSEASINAQGLALRADVFILPFWNVFGVIGKSKISADIRARFNGLSLCVGVELPNGSCLGQGLDLPSTDVPVHLDLDFEIVGIGTTLGAGYKHIFGAFTASYSHSVLEDSGSEGSEILVLNPVVGYQFTEARAQIFLAAEYQDYAASMTGYVANPGFAFDVGVSAEKWSYGLGFRKEFGQHYNITGIYTAGASRDSITLALGYRY